MSSISSFQSGVVLHCERRLSKLEFKALKDAYSLGVDTPGLKKYLGKGLYNPVLCAIWGESDLKRRVEWLRANSDLHVPLMLELAIAEFEIEPTIQKILDVSVPLIISAALRAQQDARCLAGSSEKNRFDEALYKIYLNVLKFKVKKIHPLVDTNRLIVQQQDRIRHFTQQRLLHIGMRSQDWPDTLPSPNWISYTLKGEEHPMKPPQEFASIRQDYFMQGEWLALSCFGKSF